MNCQAIQNKILAQADPRQPTEPLRDHLDGCAACQAWWKQAGRLEQLLEHLPAPPPPADKKADVLEELAVAGPLITTVPRPVLAARPLVSRRVLTYTGGLAAAVLVVFGAWFALKPAGTKAVAAEPRHPLLEKVIQRDRDLARADTPTKRLEILAGLADDLAAETRSLARAANPEELKELAGLYQKVVDEGIVTRAKNIPPNSMTLDQKKKLFNQVSKKLADTQAEVEKLSNDVPPESKPALKKIADAARDGQRELAAKLASEGA